MNHISREEIGLLYGLLERLKATMINNVEELGTGGLPEEAMVEQGNVDTVEATLEIVAEYGTTTFPADTVAP